MAHHGLNDMSRRRRLAKHLSHEDAAYFKDNVKPVMDEVYTSLQSQGRVPVYQTADNVMSKILAWKRRSGNIVLGDERAFIYPEYINAHKEDGRDALATLYTQRMEEYTTAQNNRLSEHHIDDVAAVIAIGERITELSRPEPKLSGARKVLRGIFGPSAEAVQERKSAEIDNLMKEAQPHWNRVIGHVYEAEAKQEDVVAFAANKDRIAAEIKGQGPLYAQTLAHAANGNKPAPP